MVPPATGRCARAFVANGGRIWAGVVCTDPRGITQDQLVESATMVTAANLVKVLAGGATALSF